MASNNAGLSVSIISAPVLYDSSVPTAGHVVDGTDFKDSRVWFGSSSSITGRTDFLKIICLCKYIDQQNIQHPFNSSYLVFYSHSSMNISKFFVLVCNVFVKIL